MFFDKKDMVSQGKMSDFVSFPLFRFILVMNLRSFDFEGHWNTLIFFDIKKRYGVRFGFVLSNSVWFGLSFIVIVKFWQ